MYIQVEFEPGGPRYVYSSPITILPDQYAIVRVFGHRKILPVIAQSPNLSDFIQGETPKIKPIVGIALLFDTQRYSVPEDTDHLNCTYKST